MTFLGFSGGILFDNFFYMSQESKLNEVLNTVNDMFEIVHFMRDNMATKTDLKKEIDSVRSDMVTKADLRKELQGFATKKDLERFATKKDLERFATKKDLERFATKKDLEGVRSEIEGIRSVMATRRDIERCATKQDLETMNSNLITHIDGFVGMHKGLDLELVSLRSKYQRLESHVNQLAKHTSLTLE